MPLQATSGAASYDAFGGGAAAVPNYIEECFSCFLYTGNGSTQTITNGIDLSGKGGLTWIKSRSSVTAQIFTDTARGITSEIISNSTAGQYTIPSGSGITSFNSNGFSLGTDYLPVNTNNQNFVSWTFRKQPKFFDVVTYTGNSVVGRQISHNLGSVPGCIIVKKLNSAGSWITYHKSLGATKYLALNTTAAQDTFNGFWNDTTPTSTVFTVGDAGEVNDAGSTYVAYLFAHNAGGFGLTGTDNVISCGSFTTDAFKTGYATLPFSEAQWILVKCASNAGSWFIVDNMRGIYTNYADANGLSANTSAAETTRNIDYGNSSSNSQFRIFGGDSVANSDYIYIAIRRGPMKVPTVGTSVFAPVARNATGAVATVTAGFAPDLLIAGERGAAARYATDKLRGRGLSDTSTTGAEQTTATDVVTAYTNTGITLGADSFGYGINSGTAPTIDWFFQRAPSFFDEVCFGSSPTTAIPHNLGVVPELIIAKDRTGASAWYVWQPSTSVRYGTLNTTAAFSAPAGSWPATSTTFEPLIYGSNIVNYLFATCAGVSKVGSYTGDGTNYKDINCGFTSGARFVMIKRTDAAGDWYVFDTARGITTGSDKILRLNSTAAEITSDEINPLSTGFSIGNNNYPCNVSGGTYIFLAIA
jgi:hypothetical protein